MKYKYHITLAAICIILLVVTVKLYNSRNELLAKTERLQSRIDELTGRDKRTSVIRRISQQMEDIAYQQKDISDKQREEAVFQTKIANDMRGRAESESHKAQIAEKQAVSAFKQADEQRALAELKQLQAEYSKRVADTLSLVALGRSLGSLSTMQYQTGNYDLASLMAYTAWFYTSRYKGDLYQPAIFNALTVNSGSVNSWTGCKGGITNIVSSRNKKGSFFTTSKYGEIVQWRYSNGDLKDFPIFNDSKCDFRDAYIDENNTLYALSYNGTLIVRTESESIKNIVLNGKGYMRIVSLTTKHLMLVSASSVSIYQREGLKLIKTISFPKSVTAVGNYGKKYFLFEKGGKLVNIDADGNITRTTTPINETVTAYVWSSDLNMGAVGTISGNIYLVSSLGHIIKKMVGHQSRITKLVFKGRNLYSSSYDCSLAMWNISAEKTEPIIIRKASSWIYCFSLLENGVVWTGEENSTLTRIVINPGDMANKIRSGIKRDFTKEEWKYYIGENIPFESFKTQK